MRKFLLTGAAICIVAGWNAASAHDGWFGRSVEDYPGDTSQDAPFHTSWADPHDKDAAWCRDHFTWGKWHDAKWRRQYYDAAIWCHDRRDGDRRAERRHHHDDNAYNDRRY